MASAVVTIDPDIFLRWSGSDVSEQDVEAFECLGCKHVVIGIPAEHTVYYDPEDSRRASFYNGAGPIKCPICEAVWYRFGYREYRVRTVSTEELSQSKWARLSIK